MADKKNLCAMIPLALHQQVSEAKDAEGMTTSEYIEKLLTEYYEMKKNGGNTTMASGTRTMAFQISEELFQRIKAHLDRETARTGKKLTQREFVLGLIEAALTEAENRQAETEAPEQAVTDADGEDNRAEETVETGDALEQEAVPTEEENQVA